VEQIGHKISLKFDADEYSVFVPSFIINPFLSVSLDLPDDIFSKSLLFEFIHFILIQSNCHPLTEDPIQFYQKNLSQTVSDSIFIIIEQLLTFSSSNCQTISFFKVAITSVSIGINFLACLYSYVI
jgi:hypothetical protein